MAERETGERPSIATDYCTNVTAWITYLVGHDASLLSDPGGEEAVREEMACMGSFLGDLRRMTPGRHYTREVRNYSKSVIPAGKGGLSWSPLAPSCSSPGPHTALLKPVLSVPSVFCEYANNRAC